MPITPQRIQAGKNDPRMLKEGAREQPVIVNMDTPQRKTPSVRGLPRFASAFMPDLVLRSFCIE
jgi:hypothetical protein